MKSALSLIRCRFAPEMSEKVLELYADANRASLSQELYRAGTLWRNEADHALFMWAVEFENLEQAKESMGARLASPALVQLMSMTKAPADTLHLEVESSNGAALSTTPHFSYLSMSVRVSEPGRSSALHQDLERIFQELEVIPGRLGALRAGTVDLKEQVVGIVTWQDYEAFATSLPRKMPYEVDLYRRVG